jgi:hypothetical protein
LTMDKDSDSVLCCASCSFAAGAVAAATWSARSAGAADGQMTTQGDAEPLKVHTPFFCTKDIGQSSPYPCGNNTLTVTFASNTFLKKQSSIVTITGLAGAIAVTGYMKISDGPNGLGHHNYFGGAFDDVDFAAGYGWWNDCAK